MENDYKRRTVMIQITEACNLNCTYCYQSNKSDKTIDLNSAKQRITKYINESNNYDEVVIDLTGGEVFFKFNLVKNLCEWTWQQKWNKPIIFHTTTNGTLIHGNIQEWIIHNKHRFSVGLSLDGTKEMHDLNRSGSYDSIDFDFFIKNWPQQAIKMTISPESISTLSDGIIQLHQRGFKVSANFAYLVDWSKSEYTKILKRELHILSNYYLNNPNIQVSNLIDMPLWSITENKGTYPKWCGTGNQMIAIDIDGHEYPCQMFMPNAMTNFNNFKSFDYKEPLNLQDEHCKDCNILPICPTCYGANLIQSGNPAIRDKDICKLTKIRADAASYLTTKKLLNGYLNLDDHRLKTTIESIQEIQSIL